MTWRGRWKTRPTRRPTPLGLPDAIMLRPTIIAIFDTVKDEIIIATPVWPDARVDAKAAFARAQERLAEAVADLEKPAAPTPPAPEDPAGPCAGGIQHDAGGIPRRGGTRQGVYRRRR